MTHHQFIWASLATVVMAGASVSESQAQVFVTAPQAFYFAPAAPVFVQQPVFVQPQVAFSVAPTPVVVNQAPAVSFYQAPVATPIVSNVAPPIISTVPATVGFYTPTTTPFPMTVSRGLFGRTIVRTPWSTTKF